MQNVYIDSVTGKDVTEQVKKMPEQQRLMYALFENKYLLVQVYSKVAAIYANTLNEVQEESWKINEELNLSSDFQLYRVIK